MAGAKLSEFISFVKTKGVAKTSHFGVFFTPIGYNTGNNLNTQNLLMLCSQVNLPGVNIATAPARLFGETFEFGYEKNYSPVTMNFYVDSNLEVKKVFDGWSNEVFNVESRTFGYYKDYTTDVEIYVQNMEHKTVYKVILYEAYPKSIQDVQMDYLGNGFMNLQVTFAYRYFKIFDSTESLQGKATDKLGNAGVKPHVLQETVNDDVSVLNSYVNDFNTFQNNLLTNVSTTYNNTKNSAAKNAKEAINSFLKKK